MQRGFMEKCKEHAHREDGERKSRRKGEKKNENGGCKEGDEASYRRREGWLRREDS